MSDIKPDPSLTLPGSERPDYRGKCLYKTGKCLNERALKTSGVAHNLCDDHRNRQNRHQRKLDAKNRLHKRERRVSVKNVKGERVASSQTKSIVWSDAAESSDNAVTFPATLPTATAVETSDEVTSTSVLTSSGNGVMFMSNASQPLQAPHPIVLQDFDGIVVPLPSYLEGPERIEFRSRIYQKVLDFISEECILRFGAKVENTSSDAPTATETVVTTPTSSSKLEAEPETK
ncbi:hypothetical protein DD238_007397 [Peronospora effusa]|uniref:Uncharacterized protein n=1 Tax=Peronospora effusa TaxID=542832 RepID=A0A3M6VB36_9STRA|nr:hypothetical protein DD238_007397 [Peronospora effusa]RQM12342.1 hypothetical protein DD237_007675 [Peronospora effusa]